MADDAELLRAYAETRSEPAFAELVSRHLSLVHSAALRRTGGDTRQAEEITQRVFISVALHARNLSHHKVLAGWLYTSTRNAVFAAARANKRRLVREGEALAMHHANTPDATDSDWARLSPTLDSVMDALNSRDREAILLHFFEGRSFRELGERMACAEDAARMRVTRALDKMRSRLRERGITSTTAALSLALASKTVVATPAGLASAVTSAALNAAAATTVGSGVALGFLKIMSAIKTSKGILSAACVLSIGAALFKASQARQAAAAFNSANAASSNTIRNLQAKLAAMERERAGIEKTRARVAAATSTPPRSGGSQIARADQIDPAKDPAFAEIKRKHQLRAVHQQYGYAFSQLKLPPADLEKLKQLLLTRMDSRDDASDIAEQAGLSSQDIETAQHQAEDSVNDEIRHFVGDAGYAALQASVKASGYSPLIATTVGIDLDAAGVPLLPDQSAALAQLFSEFDSGQGQEARTQNPDPQSGLTPFYSSLLDRASATLTPAQIPVLKAYFLEIEQEAQYHRPRSPSASVGH